MHKSGKWTRKHLWVGRTCTHTEVLCIHGVRRKVGLSRALTLLLFFLSEDLWPTPPSAENHAGSVSTLSHRKHWGGVWQSPWRASPDTHANLNTAAFTPQHTAASYVLTTWNASTLQFHHNKTFNIFSHSHLSRKKKTNFNCLMKLCWCVRLFNQAT